MNILENNLYMYNMYSAKQKNQIKLISNEKYFRNVIFTVKLYLQHCTYFYLTIWRLFPYKILSFYLWWIWEGHVKLAKQIQIHMLMKVVMANLSCQTDYIWNQLKPKQLVTPVGDFLEWIIWSGKTHPKSRTHLLVRLTRKDTEEGRFCFCVFAEAFLHWH